MGIPYVGAPAVASTDIATKGYVAALLSQNLEQPAIDTLITAGFSAYATKEYVDERDALNATKAYVDTADDTRVRLTDVGDEGGPVPLDENGWVDSALVDIASTQRWPTEAHSPSSYHGSPVTAGDVESTLYTTTVADPGYPYNLLLFGTVDVSATADDNYPTVVVRAGTSTGTLVGVGYGIGESYGIAPAFDAVGDGYSGTSGSFSFSHSAQAGAYAIVDISIYGNFSVSSVTYGGSAMTLLDSQAFNNSAANGRLVRFGLSGVLGGVRTVAVTLSGSTRVCASSVSYLNVTSVGTAEKTYGTGTMSQNAASVSSAQTVVQSFGCISATTLITPTGGTNRYNTGNLVSGTYYALLSTGDGRAAPTTFGGSATSSGAWAGMATVLTSSVVASYSSALIQPYFATLPASTPTFDAAAGGGLAIYTGAKGEVAQTAFSFYHTAAADAYVIIDVVVLGTADITQVLYDGVEVPVIVSHDLNDTPSAGTLYRYGVRNTTAGTKAISIYASANAYVAATSVSYRGVKEVLDTTVVHAGGVTEFSNGAEAWEYGGQRVVQSFAASQTAPAWEFTGGTVRNQSGYVLSAGTKTAAIAVMDSDEDTTFIATATTIANAAGIQTTLQGVLGSPAQSGRTGSTTLYVRLLSSAAGGSTTATVLKPGLAAIPIPA